jgi:hypothetical protein
LQHCRSQLAFALTAKSQCKQMSVGAIVIAAPIGSTGKQTKQDVNPAPRNQYKVI